ncbi:MAG: DUF4265 domain-containing protein [bacterium]
MDTQENRIKIAIPISIGSHKGADETLWALKVEDNKAKIDNIPVHVNNVSLSDIVEYGKSQDNFIFNFVKVIEKSGIKTIRLSYKDSLLKNRTKIFKEKIFPKLQSLGCSYEGSPEIIAISVPKSTDLDQVVKELNEFKDKGYEIEIADPGTN